MNMDKTVLIFELDQLAHNFKRRTELQMKLAVSDEDYLQEHLPIPTKKALLNAYAPSKKRVTRAACFFLAFLLICVTLIVSAVFSYSKSDNIEAVLNDPGEEYESWLNSFGSVKTFEDLEDDWEHVQDAWRKKGVKVNWKYVLKASETYHLNTFYSNEFDRHLRNELKQDISDLEYRASMLIAVALVLLIPIIICIKKFIGVFSEYRDNKRQYEFNIMENRRRTQYNEKELPKLLDEWEKLAREVLTEYYASQSKMKAELVTVEGAIAQRAQLLPEHYHQYASDIAMILQRGRADSIKEAINVFESDMHDKKMAEMERQRMDDERRHREEMERAERLAAEQARKNAITQQQMMQKQLNAEKQARENAAIAESRRQLEEYKAQDRAKHAAIQRCAKCANYNACGPARNNPNCGSFRPK